MTDTRAKRLSNLPGEELHEYALKALIVLSHVWEVQYRRGHKRTQLEAIVTIFMASVEPPLWARLEFVKICGSTPDSWDDVFGPPVEKGKSAKAARRAKESGPKVVPAVTRARERGTKFPEAFDEAAKSLELSEYRLSPAKVREIYYGSMRKVRECIPRIRAARCLKDALAIEIILNLLDLERAFQKAGLNFEKEIFRD
jgi:hypothetical protein